MINSISFPRLGLSFDINRVAFTVFGKEIFWYALIILTGYVLAVAYCAKRAPRRGVSSDAILDIALYGLIFGLVGARLYYVIFDFDSVRGSILNVFKVWEGGLAIYGGIIGAVATAFVYCRKKSLPTLKVFDLCSPGLLIGQAIGRWGNFVNAEVYGGATSLPWGMSINGGECVHPLFLYESLWNALGFALTHFLGRKNHPDGVIFFFYIAWYSTGRLMLEGMRRSEYILYLIDGRLGISQAVAACGIIVGVVGLVRVLRRPAGQA